MSASSASPSLDGIFRENASDLFGLLDYYTGDAELAQELVVAVFRRLSGDRAGTASRLRAFAIAIDQLRGLPPGARDATAGVGDQRLRQGLGELAPEPRLILALRFGGGLAVEEMSELLDESPEDVGARITQGLEALRGATGDDERRRDDG